MHEEAGLIRLGGGVLAAIVGIAAVAWATGTGSGPRAEGEPVAPAMAQAAPGAGPAAAEAPAGPGEVRACTVEGGPVPLPDAVHEASGLALSRRSEGVLWTHSDAGRPEVLAVAADGTVRGTVRIAGAGAEDWEDVAVGPCAGGSCLYVADIGDNDASRARVTVYRVPEPDPADGASRPAEALHATYPEGPQDAEALFVDAAGRIHVVTKGETGPVDLYRFPERPQAGSVSRLERVAVLSGAEVPRPERVTGADASPDGRWVALRTLESVAFHPYEALAAGRPDGAVRFDLSAAGEAQGEGIAVGEGGVVYLASEGGKKKDPATLTRVACPLPG
ncbi:MAG TPA: hypothetical protein VHG51_21650 [Longimicrobiaceae bacterium]|nr:hypothetical protein [Longimicrobiaceae bacterium]